MIIGICLLFSGCGTDKENTDASLQEQHSEDIVAESESEETEIGKEEEQIEEDAGSEDETEQTEEGAVKEETSWSSISYMEAYRRFLEAYMEESEFTQFARVTLALIDDDNVPELILIEDNSHAAGVKVYTYYQKSMAELGEFGSSGWMQYAERGGMILSGFTGHGECDSDFFQVKDGEVKLVCSLMSYEQPDGLYELYEIDGVSVTEEAHDKKWKELYEAYEYAGIGYDDAFAMQDAEIADVLAEALNALLLRQTKALEGYASHEEVLKQNVLIAAGAQESNILLWEYDDYDGDGDYEAFMIAGRTFDNYGNVEYSGTLYFAGADGRTLELDNSFGSYRMIDGKMDFGPDRKYLFFYTDICFTANESELWTVRDGKPVDESDLFYNAQVVYHGKNERNEFEIWVDAYDHYYDIEDDMWIWHTWKPYFYHYNSDMDRIEAYGGKIISEEAFEELSETNLIEEIKAEGYTVGDIIHWDNDVVTINYENHENHNDSTGYVLYENVIWDNNVKDFWRKEERNVSSWENAGEGGSYRL